jgi:hypothetical protein
MAFDQHDNGARLDRLGVDRSISPRRFRAPAVEKLLDGLLRSPAVAPSCAAAAERVRRAEPLAEVWRWSEQAATRSALCSNDQAENLRFERKLIPARRASG